RCCCCRACPSRNLAIAPISLAIPCPCTRTEYCHGYQNSCRWVEWCWAAFGGSRIAARKLRLWKVGMDRRLGVGKRARNEDQVHFLEGGLSVPDGGGFLRNAGALHSGSRTVDQLERSIPLGHLDRVRRSLRRDAGGRWIHADRGGAHLQHQATAPDRASDDPDRVSRLRLGVRGAHVRPGAALPHLASAGDAQSA